MTSVAVAAAIVAVAAAGAGAGAVAHHLATEKLHSGTVAALEPWTVASRVLSVDLSACQWYQIEPQRVAAAVQAHQHDFDDPTVAAACLEDFADLPNVAAASSDG